MASILKQQYTRKDTQGRKTRHKSKYWYIDYKAANGTRKRVKGFKDKAATTQLAAKLGREAELAQAGIVDKYAAHIAQPTKLTTIDARQTRCILVTIAGTGFSPLVNTIIARSHRAALP